MIKGVTNKVKSMVSLLLILHCIEATTVKQVHVKRTAEFAKEKSKLE